MSAAMDRDTKRVILTGDPISKVHRLIIGDAARLHIPLRDAVSLRDYAEHLVMLAGTLRRLSHDTRQEQWHLLLDARTAIKATDKMIRAGVVPARR